MTEQMNHRAAIEWAVDWSGAQGSPRIENGARCYLASVKAAWPGVVPTDAERDRHGWYGHGDAEWIEAANKFECDYPGLKVDEPWLQEVLK